MATDPRYLVTSPLQELFRDKTSGAPLRNGVVYFWKDDDRTVEKPVYKQTGSPGDGYDYAELPNPLTLSSIGTFQDPNTNDDIKVYFKPYVSDDSNEIELYYVEVYSEGGKVNGVLQFTRQGWPPDLAAEQTTAQDLTNYVPNGQFLIHTDIPAEGVYVAGEIRQTSTILSQGGWTFDRASGTTAKDIVTFISIASTDNPTGNPRFAVNVNCETPNAGDTVKDLRLKFQDVNKFASETDTYTYAFSAENNNTGSITAQLILIKNYGTGGSSTDEIPLSTITIPEAYTTISTSFNFGTNESESITDDSYLQLAIRFPTASGFNVQLTDFILTPGTVTVTDFPPTPDTNFRRDAIAGWMSTPAYDSSDLYLPLRLTPSGLEFDRSDIGKVYAAMYSTPQIGELLCDGSQYETAILSSDGIPYSRLQSVLYNSTLNIPIFGTGLEFLAAYPSDVTNQLIMSTNFPGSTTDAADGTTATGFAFATIHSGSDYGIQGHLLSGGTVYAINTFIGVSTGVNAGTSGFTVSLIREGSSFLKQIASITPAGSVAALAGTYFIINSTVDAYYMWFTVDGAGADPSPLGTGIKVDLLSTYSLLTVALIIAQALSGHQQSTIDFLAGSSVPAGSFFNLYTTFSDQYYVWYSVDSAGTDPAPSGKTPIKVDIAAADTDVQVAAKTQIAINSKYFAVPDLRGQFLRGWNDTDGVDPEPENRWSPNSLVYGDAVGTQQIDELLAHSHTYLYTNAALSTGGADVATPNNFTTNTGTTGSFEIRPVNTYVNYVIKY